MSLLKNLKSIFVVEEAGQTTSKSTRSESVEKAATPPPPRKPVTNDATIPQNQSAPAGKVNDKFINVLLGVMEKNNIEGFDYLEFKKSLQSLSKMPMDEQTRFQSAFAMAQTMNVTPQRLIETAGFYINLLDQEEKKFEQALNNQRKQQIGNKEGQIQQLENTIKEKAVHIKRLTEEIEQHQTKAETLRKEIGNRSIKIETTKNNFIASYNLLVSQIQDDVERMKQYLK